MLALILKCCPVAKHTHKPGYDEKIVVKNYKKMHLRFLIHPSIFFDFHTLT